MLPGTAHEPGAYANCAMLADAATGSDMGAAPLLPGPGPGGVAGRAAPHHRAHAAVFGEQGSRECLRACQPRVAGMRPAPKSVPMQWVMYSMSRRDCREKAGWCELRASLQRGHAFNWMAHDQCCSANSQCIHNMINVARTHRTLHHQISRKEAILSAKLPY